MVSVPPEPGKVKLLDRVREAIRFKHYSLRTERTYIDWIKRFIIYHGKRHPETMGADEVRRFLNNLASERLLDFSPTDLRCNVRYLDLNRGLRR